MKYAECERVKCGGQWLYRQGKMIHLYQWVELEMPTGVFLRENPKMKKKKIAFRIETESSCSLLLCTIDQQKS